VSVAGFLPGFGRGGITHSFVVTEPGVPGAGDVAGAAGLIVKAGGRAAIAGVIGGGEPAEEGVDTLAGVAIVGGDFSRES
jgi:hypothetical protein